MCCEQRMERNGTLRRLRLGFAESPIDVSSTDVYALIFYVDVPPLQCENFGNPQRSGRSDQHKRTQHQAQLVDDREGLNRSQNDRVEVAGRGLADKADRIRLLRPRQESNTLGMFVNQTDDLSDLRPGLVFETALPPQLFQPVL